MYISKGFVAEMVDVLAYSIVHYVGLSLTHALLAGDFLGLNLIIFSYLILLSWVILFLEFVPLSN